MATETFIDSNNVERIAGRLEPPVAGGAVTISAVDPGAIGAGLLWLDTSTPGPVLGHRLRVRNALDSGWDDPIVGSYDSISGDYTGVQASGTSASIRAHNGIDNLSAVIGVDAGSGVDIAIPLGGALASNGGTVQLHANVTGGQVIATAGDDGGDPTVIVTADGDAGSFAVASAALGFFGAGPVAQPVVPLTTPTVQNVIDALLALGLVVQHD